MTCDFGNHIYKRYIYTANVFGVIIHSHLLNILINLRRMRMVAQFNAVLREKCSVKTSLACCVNLLC